MTALNKLGLSVVARALALSRPDRPGLLWNTPATIGVAVAVIMAILVPVLLAGPAFAVGLRRRRRELAEIAAQGGSAAHLRLIVLADGLILGGLAALAATGLGIAAGLLAVPVIAPVGRPDRPARRAVGRPPGHRRRRRWPSGWWRRSSPPCRPAVSTPRPCWPAARPRPSGAPGP